jgi:hypothetical protein
MRRRLPVTRTEKIDASNIRLLHVANFGLCYRQHGITMIRTTFGVLEEVLHAQPNNIYLPDLPESFVQDLLYWKGDANNYKQHLPPEFYEFIDMAESDGEIETLTINRITEADTRKFFDKSDKSYLTVEDIKKRLPAEYRDLYEAFLP